MQRTMISTVAVMALMISAAWGLTPSALADRAVEAWGGQEALENAGVVKLDVTEKEGNQTAGHYILYYDARTGQRRMEMPENEVVLAGNTSSGWIMVKDKVDDRPQSGVMAPQFINMKLLPALFPFTLGLNGVTPIAEPKTVPFQGQPATTFDIITPKKFFSSPFVNSRWTIAVARDDGHYLGAEFLPTQTFGNRTENFGMRFTVQDVVEVNGLRFASTVLIDSLDGSGNPTGARRTMTIQPTIVESPSPALFLHPDKIRELDE